MLDGGKLIDVEPLRPCGLGSFVHLGLVLAVEVGGLVAVAVITQAVVAQPAVFVPQLQVGGHAR